MDKILYISYEFFKKEPDKGLMVTLKDGSEYFYQFMCGSHKRLESKWSDLHAVTMINSNYVESYKPMQLIATPEEFQRLTHGYGLSVQIEKKLKNDLAANGLVSAILEKVELTIESQFCDKGLMYATDTNQKRFVIDKQSTLDFMPQIGQILNAEVNKEGYVLKAGLLHDADLTKSYKRRF